MSIRPLLIVWTVTLLVGAKMEAIYAQPSAAPARSPTISEQIDLRIHQAGQESPQRVRSTPLVISNGRYPDRLPPHPMPLTGALLPKWDSKLPGEFSYKPRHEPAFDSPPPASDRNLDRPAALVLPATARAFVWSFDVSQVLHLEPVGKRRPERIDPMVNPFVDRELEFALRQHISSPANSPPPLNSNLPDPFAHAKAVELSLTLSDAFLPSRAFERPGIQLPVTPEPTAPK